MITNDKYVKRYFFSSLLLIVLFTVVWKASPYISKNKNDHKKLQENYLKLESEYKQISHSILQALEIDSLLSWNDIANIVNRDKITTYIYRNDSLTYWNGNDINSNSLSFLPTNKMDVVHFKNGWFAVYKSVKNNCKIIQFKNIEHEYAINNDFLIPFNDKNYVGGNNYTLTKDFTLGKEIFNTDNEPIIAIKTVNLRDYNKRLTTVLFFLFIVGSLFIALLVVRLHVVTFNNLINCYLKAIFVSFDLIILFILIAYLGVPAVLKNSFWFSSWHTIIPFVQSRGMAVLFVTFAVVLSIALDNIFRRENRKKIESLITIFIVAFFNFLFLFFLLYNFNRFYTVTLKLHDNAIGFLFRGDFIELYFISGIVISLYFIQQAFIRLLNLNRKTMIYYTIYTAILAMVAFLISQLSPLVFVSIFFMQFLFVAIIFFTPATQNIAFLRYLLIVVLFAIGFAVIINDSYSHLKNRFHLNVVKALKINRDFQLEQDFLVFKNTIEEDTTLQKSITKMDEADFNNFIRQKYFNNRFNNYDVQLTICKNSDLLEIHPEGSLMNCNSYFKNLKTGANIITGDTSLVLIDEEGESRYYIGEVSMPQDSLGNLTLYVEMFSSIIPSGLGYPELLIDNNNQVDLIGYSIAKFHKNLLVYKMGEYDYHSNYSFMKQYPNSSFYYLNNYLHYKIKISNSDVLIVSRPVRTLAEQTATFSLLFLLFSFIAVMVYFFTIGSKQISMFKYSFRARLQVFIMLTILFIFILISTISGYYFNDIRQTFIINQLNEKTKSVLIELQQKFPDSEFTGKTDDEYLQEHLKKLSIVFFTDINIYKTSGNLLATSRPKVFEAGLLSTLINPNSYQQVIINKKLFYLTEEQIGTLTYYSAYVPLIINQPKPEGILNLPYFARQSEVKRSFLPLLFNFLNIFVIIGIFGTFFALIVAKLLTRPLAMLQQSLSEIRIDKKNEPIVWKNDDEIGRLIAEYNLMVKKLEESALLLKRSERETAWREMAQQVAHEIRNPLTPMKLNIQYLQKIYNENSKEFTDKWKSISSSLIDQIESLNEVASTFSDLAKSRTLEKEKIELIQLISSAIDLYSNNNKATVVFKPTINNAFVLGKQNDLLRVFNNLIKNAVQSVLPDGGIIEISVEQNGNLFEISIKDSGKGIPEELKEKIFQPYFTTKSGGTGIGLAIVKNIIDEMGGEISYVSQAGKGTLFTIKLKRAT